MLRFRRVLLASVAAVALSASVSAAFAQTNVMTAITATNINVGNTTANGTLCLTAVDQYHNPIEITRSGGGFYAKNRPFCQTLTAGALAGSLQVPDSGTDSAAGHPYMVSVYDTPSQTLDTFYVQGITGTTWSLDTYTPPTTVSTTQAFTFTQAAGAPTGTCTYPALDVNSTDYSFWTCGTDGAWHKGAPGPAGATGPTGATGPAGAALNVRGTYAAGTTYAIGDAAVYTDGILYASIAASNVGHTPPSSPTYWTPVAGATPGIRLVQDVTQISGVTTVASIAPGTDATSFTGSGAAINAFLAGGHKELVVNGVGIGLEVTLAVPSNSEIECMNGGGFIALPALKAPMVENADYAANPSSCSPTTADTSTGHSTNSMVVSNQCSTNIVIHGCTFNANESQASVGGTEGSDGKADTAFRLLGVNGFELSNSIIYDSPTYGLLAQNGTNFKITDSQDIQTGATRYQTDAWHFNGPMGSPAGPIVLSFYGVHASVMGDDFIAVNADDWISDEFPSPNATFKPAGFVSGGPITNVHISGVHANAQADVARLLSFGSLISNVSIEDVDGSTTSHVVSMVNAGVSNPCRISDVMISRLDVQANGGVSSPPLGVPAYIYDSCEQLGPVTINNVRVPPAASGPMPFFQQIASTHIFGLSVNGVFIDDSLGTALPSGSSWFEFAGTTDSFNINNVVLQQPSASTAPLMGGATGPTIVTASNCTLPSASLLSSFTAAPTTTNGDCYPALQNISGSNVSLPFINTSTNPSELSWISLYPGVINVAYNRNPTNGSIPNSAKGGSYTSTGGDSTGGFFDWYISPSAGAAASVHAFGLHAGGMTIGLPINGVTPPSGTCSTAGQAEIGSDGYLYYCPSAGGTWNQHAGPPVSFRGAWAAGTTYAIGDAVSYNGSSYISLTAANVGLVPASNPSNWAVLAAQGATGTTSYSVPSGYIGVYRPGVSYALNAVVSFTDGNNYTSLANGNQGNAPDISPSWWAPITGATTYSMVTVGTSGQATNGGASNESFVLPTAIPDSGALTSVSATIHTATAGSTLKFLILTGGSGTFTVVDSFTVTIASAITSDTLKTFNAGTDFAARNVTAGEYIGYYVSSSGAIPAIMTGASSGGFWYNSVTSDPGSSAGTYTLYGSTVALDLSCVVTYAVSAAASPTLSSVASNIASSASVDSVSTKRTPLWTETFSGTSLPANWLAAGGGVWTANNGLISPTNVTGYGSVFYLPRYYALGQRTIRVRLELLSAGSFAIGSVVSDHANGAGAQASLITINSTTGTIAIANQGFVIGANPGTLASATIPFTLVAGEKYQVTININDRVLTASIYDPITAEVGTVTYGNNSTDAGAVPWGTFADYPAFVAISGQWKVDDFRILANAVRPHTVYLGDSITYGYNLPLGTCWAETQGLSTGASFVLDGRPGGSSFGVLGRVLSEIIPLAPEQVEILDGTNDTGTGTLTQYENNMAAAISMLQAAGIRVILGTVPPFTPQQAFVNSENAWLLSQTGVNFVRFDLGMSNNNDGVTENPSLYQGDETHPNAAGSAAMVARHPVDVPFVFD